MTWGNRNQLIRKYLRELERAERMMRDVNGPSEIGV